MNKSTNRIEPGRCFSRSISLHPCLHDTFAEPDTVSVTTPPPPLRFVGWSPIGFWRPDGLYVPGDFGFQRIFPTRDVLDPFAEWIGDR